MIKKALIFFLMAFLASFLNNAEEPKKDKELMELVEAERNFAKESAMFGRKKAFVDNLASECLVFNDKWISKGREFFNERKDSPTILKWEPDFADIPQSGDFGVTSGMWELQEYKPNTKPMAKGYFLSVWKKQNDGVWKVALDVGTIVPISDNEKTELSFSEMKLPEIISDKESAIKEILEGEKHFQECSKNGNSTDCQISFFCQGARLIKAGSPLVKNEEEIKKNLAEIAKSIAWKIDGCDVSSSSDLGFTYGTVETIGETKFPQACFVRIWKKDNLGNWRILIELLG